MKTLIDSEIINRTQKFNSKFAKAIKLIQKYDRIAIFRHIRPDYDAIGSQMGMYYWLKDNFKDKEIIYVGENHVTLTPRCFPPMMVIEDAWFEKPFLAIILDSSNSNRVSDERFKKADSIIKIDHHPEVDKYGNVQIVDTTMSAAGELLANMLIRADEYKVGKKCASYLYKAIVGDSNRFLYAEVNAHTFAVAEFLVKTGLKVEKIYKEMYSEDISSIEFTKWVLGHYHITPQGVAYYVMEKETLDELHVQPERGKDCLGLFDHYDNIHIWLSVSYDEPKGCYRISIRSDGISIEKVAIKYGGGGHSQASGAKLKSLDDLPKLLSDLDELLK